MAQLSIFDTLPVEKESPKDSSIEITNYFYEQAQIWQPKKDNQLKQLSDTYIKEKTPHGWMFKYLWAIDGMSNKRWTFWEQLQQVKNSTMFTYWTEGLVDDFVKPNLEGKTCPIIDFSKNEHVQSYYFKILDRMSGCGLNLRTAFEYLIDWFLYGFGHEDFMTLPEIRHQNEINSMLYQYIDLVPLLAFPYDYLSFVLAEVNSTMTNQGLGYFPTPLELCAMMNKVVMGDRQKLSIEICHEPSAGTGSMILEYSNSGGLCINTIDLNDLAVKCSLVNYYLYCPQYVRPIWWLCERNHIYHGNTLTQEMTHDYNEKYRRLISTVQD